ncbi:MAG: hypothetical protein WCS43_11895, partial [Verrucomicrobiota bacterium]
SFIHGGEHPKEAEGKKLKEDVTTKMQEIDPEAPPPENDEIVRGGVLIPPTGGTPAHLADAVFIERELSQVEADDDAAKQAADDAVAAATATGDPKAVKVAETAREGVTGGRAELARAVVRIANGHDVADLTPKELAAIGFKPGKLDKDGKPGKPIEMTAAELKKAGLDNTLVYAGADGSPIITDEAIKLVEAMSPRARAVVRMGERQAKDAAKARALSTVAPDGTRGDPVTGGTRNPPHETNAPVEFDVPMRSGAVVRVRATTSADAERAAAGSVPAGADTTSPRREAAR